MKYKIYTFIAVIAFAAYPTLSKFIVGQNHPLVIVAVTEFASAFILLLVYGLIQEVKKVVKYKKQDGYLFLVVLCASVLAPSLNMIGLQHSTVLNMLVVNTIQMPITILLSIFILNEKADRKLIISILLLFVGVYLYGSNGGQKILVFGLNDLYFVGASFLFGLSDIIYKKKIDHLPHELVLIARNVVGGVCLAIILLFLSFSQPIAISFDAQSVMGMALIVCIPILIAQFLWYTSLTKLPASEVSMFGSMYTFFAALIAVVVLHESLQIGQMVGGAVMIVSVIISHLHFRSHKLHKHHIALQTFKHH